MLQIKHEKTERNKTFNALETVLIIGKGGEEIVEYLNRKYKGTDRCNLQ